ncbi:Cysteine dioxygenase [Fulvia fulva]|uniref:Cysteine dioxygenase n=1 Tax=Passalora fulva TaxID=5499 RepID=A0A9Q8P2S9_PASFU|nr:Cysteine dioxygenase [Fulvia fulva]KAK4634181.1 Cysteine dioxygenase [Fulvia fulva]KAK4636594.1 Cysteine dioxygenase [Fulvia fulva]UJO10982.1 Cysteine dioxygenase [Fulvia fulva]WPV09773.1 Cysteine dioxygenase [Fulvia fulva]WPV23144.1 Cysteine dioxygenase [Fulvia fulva]
MDSSPKTSDVVTAAKPASIHDSARGSPEPLDAFHSLVRSINTILGPCNGIDSADVDVEELKKLMLAYDTNEDGQPSWLKYAFRRGDMNYTRNLVDNCNGKSNLLVLVWTPGKGSPIHDHANAHCVMKILKGSLTETIYGWPCQRPDSPADCATALDSVYPTTKHTCSAGQGGRRPSELHIKRTTTYGENEVTYMSDQLGLHRISNQSDDPDDYAVSLHLYTPPNAAKHGCHIFNEATGKSSHVKQNHFHSEFGVEK